VFPLEESQGELTMFHLTRGAIVPALMTLLLLAPAPLLRADSKETIDSGRVAALEELRKHTGKAGELLDQAAGVLVFPDVVKMGFGVGGEFGEGTLLVPGKPTSYFTTAGASFGLQAGIQKKSKVLLFMTQEALKKFQNSTGWTVGVDGSVALATLGADGSIDANTLQQAVIGFVFSNEGLMYNLTLEGTKITRIAR
jgi:lipid-binding SYLF domain-containing protein